MEQTFSNFMAEFKNSMGDIQTQLASLKSEASTTVSESRLNKIDILETQLAGLAVKVFNFFEVMNNRFFDIEQKVDENQQYSRRNCLLLHGVPEMADEDATKVALQVFKEKLGVTIEESQIDRAHRIGNKKKKRTVANAVKEGTRPIIIKFVSYGPRNQVFSVKRKLKNSNIVITESLTKMRLELLKCARVKYGMKNVYTLDGRINVVINQHKYTVLTKKELESLPEIKTEEEQITNINAGVKTRYQLKQLPAPNMKTNLSLNSSN